MKKVKLTAVSFRLILSVLLCMIAAIIIAAALIGTSKLKDFSTEVSQAASDAKASQNSIQILQKIKQDLDSKKDVVDRAASIVADSKGYQYQDQIIKDLNGYAAASGLTITNFSFITPATTAGKPIPTTGASAAPSGVKATSASITLKTPVDYIKLMQFIHSIEQNLTKMQLSRLTLSKGTASNEISTDILEIQVYIN